MRCPVLSLRPWRSSSCSGVSRKRLDIDVSLNRHGVIQFDVRGSALRIICPDERHTKVGGAEHMGVERRS